MVQAGQKISEYVLQEKIGEGGFGEVWRAKHPILDDMVAVKIPTDPAYVDQLRTEGRLQRSLKHRNIVQTIGLDPAADPPYCVMEFVPGTSLRGYLKSRGQLPFREAAAIAAQILEALAFAHSQGVIHRDLKPENVLITPGSPPVVKVSDFGLGRVVEAVATSLYLSGQHKSSESRGVVGTLDYMAPEQKRGAPADARSDVYSFGLVFYEMLMAELPVGAFRYPADVYPDVPVQANDFIRRCLGPSPTERFANAGETLAALSRLVGEGDFDEGASGISFRRGEAFVFDNAVEVYTLRELVDALLSHWDAGKQALYGARLEPWLRTIREKELSRRAAEIRVEDPDGDVGLQKFIEATGLMAPPRMDLDVSELSLPDIARGETKTVRIHVTRFGRGILWGEASVENAPAWVTPAKQSFKGDRTHVEVSIATAVLAAGRSFEFKLRLVSNGGSAEVPVRFRIGPRPPHLEVPVPEVHLTGAKGSRLTGHIRVRNAGDSTLSLSASWSDDWVQVDQIHDLGPGEERDVAITVRPPRAAGTLVSRVTLVSSGGAREIYVRVTVLASTAGSSFLFGLVIGLVPFVAEVLGAILVLDAVGGAFTKEPRPDRRSKWAFLAGLLPGVTWHIWWLF